MVCDCPFAFQLHDISDRALILGPFPPEHTTSSDNYDKGAFNITDKSVVFTVEMSSAMKTSFLFTYHTLIDVWTLEIASNKKNRFNLCFYRCKNRAKEWHILLFARFNLAMWLKSESVYKPASSIPILLEVSFWLNLRWLCIQNVTIKQQRRCQPERQEVNLFRLTGNPSLWSVNRSWNVPPFEFRILSLSENSAESAILLKLSRKSKK